jgi:hypothetical protein
MNLPTIPKDVLSARRSISILPIFFSNPEPPRIVFFLHGILLANPYNFTVRALFIFCQGEY